MASGFVTNGYNQRMAFVRRRLQDQGMAVDEAPDDEEIRETYNFAPGYYGAVYRPDTPDHGFENREPEGDAQERENEGHDASKADDVKHGDIKYKLQKMRWGLIPFWTKRQPDYGSMMRTINCRDDSLMENRGMWTSMKKKKRCIVVCQGFYEWLKKGPGGKEKVPHFIKRKDGDLMCFAGLWDCVQYEGLPMQLWLKDNS
jgi:putative SOS response-associated peptidase YedK